MVIVGVISLGRILEQAFISHGLLGQLFRGIKIDDACTSSILIYAYLAAYTNGKIGGNGKNHLEFDGQSGIC